MEKIVQQGILYDFYGELLTKHQRQIYEYIVYDNMSLGEIAAEQGISRQGVHDLIKRCDKILEEYEAKLKLVEKFNTIKEQIKMMDEKVDAFMENDNIDKESFGKELKILSEQIMSEL